MKIISKKSPCLGICKTNNKNTCIGCLRTTAEIKNWRTLNNSEKKSLWREIRNRRRNYCGNLLVKDQLKREMEINFPIKKIISLAPTLTQIIYDFGLENLLVGISTDCPKGNNIKFKKQVLDETKHSCIALIEELDPDLIITAKEIIPEIIFEKLEKKYPIWLSNAVDITSNIRAMELLLEILPCSTKASELVGNIISLINSTPGSNNPDSSFLIWKNLYKTAAAQIDNTAD
jgi:predicted Fe-S protein YdhL (DUF1289 family)